MPARSTILVAISATAAIAALSGCGGDKGDSSSAPLLAPAATTSAKAEPYSDMTAKELLDRAETDMRDSGAMTVDMNGMQDGSPMQVKAAMNTGGSCAVAMRMDGDDVQLVSPGGSHVYMKAPAAFWKDNAGPNGGKASDVLGGKWVKLTRQMLEGSSFSDLCTLDGMMDTLTSDDGDGTLAKGEPTTLNGKPVVTLIETYPDETDTLYISTGDTPYVVKLETTEGDSPSTGTFTDFGRMPHVSVPPRSQTVDLAGLGLDTGGGFTV
jgi:hypothetical protein